MKFSSNDIKENVLKWIAWLVINHIIVYSFLVYLTSQGSALHNILNDNPDLHYKLSLVSWCMIVVDASRTMYVASHQLLMRDDEASKLFLTQEPAAYVFFNY